MGNVKRIYVEKKNDYAVKGKELQEDIAKTVLDEMIGFAATSNFSRCSGEIGYPEYDDIKDPVQHHNAVCLSMFLDYKTIINRKNYQNIDEYIDASTERGKKLRDTICKKMNFTSLEFQSLDGIIKAIGLPKCKLCTYCWNGKE